MATYRIHLTMTATYEFTLDTEAELDSDDFDFAVQDAWANVDYADYNGADINIDAIEREEKDASTPVVYLEQETIWSR